MFRFFTYTLCLLLPLAAMAQTSMTPDSATVDRDEVARGNNVFATTLYGQLRNTSDNVFLSPESISIAMALTYAGARGKTAEEIANTLHFTLDRTRLHSAMAMLLRDINAGGPAHGYQLRTVNALWLQQEYGFREEYASLVEQYYGAALKYVDYINSAPYARSLINDWVVKQTDHKIRDLIAPGAVSASTRMVLTNAVYFKGDWLTPFNKADTRDEAFHIRLNRNINASLMKQTGTFGYYEGIDFKAVQVPYQGNDLAMVVILPNAMDGLASLERAMTPGALAEWGEKLDNGSKTIQIYLPKFQVTSGFSLSRTLGAMGIHAAFDSTRADFSGLAQGLKTNNNLSISDVIHKAYITVDEQGTEAAASSAALAPLTGAPQTGPLPVFKADHPFVFLIRDTRSGSILFMGRVLDPSHS